MGDWSRPLWQAGGGDALVHYLVFGELEQPLRLTRDRYRIAGPPEELELATIARDSEAGRSIFHDFTEDTSNLFAADLHGTLPQSAAAVRDAPYAYVVSGTISDPRALTYLRDTIGVVMCMLESGGVGVLDTQTFRWWSPSGWHRELFEPDDPQADKHVQIFVSEESHGEGRWYHTRGMRKFGRPDVSVHDVPPERGDAVDALVRRLIEGQARGQILPSGQTIHAKGLPAGLECRHEGSLDDPEFNNVHVELTWPQPNDPEPDDPD